MRSSSHVVRRRSVLYITETISHLWHKDTQAPSVGMELRGSPQENSAMFPGIRPAPEQPRRRPWKSSKPKQQSVRSERRLKCGRRLGNAMQDFARGNIGNGMQYVALGMSHMQNPFGFI